MDPLKISAEEAESLKRQHVKHELMDYRHYCSRIDWLDEKIARIDHKLNGGVSAAPFSNSISTVSAKDSWITAAITEQDKLLKEKAVVDYHVDQVETWLSYLEEKYYKALYSYIVINNCTKLEECAKELGYTYKRALLIDVEAAITQIIEKS